MRILRYVEQCTGSDHNGPAWIALVGTSKSGRTFYFNGRALQRAVRGHGEGNYFDVESGEAYWVSGVKSRGSNRHWAGSGLIQVEESAVSELLEQLDAESLDRSLYRVVPDLPVTDPARIEAVLNEPM